MTTAETGQRLQAAGLTDQQATGIADAFDSWERGVFRDYLDARIADVRREIAELKAELITRIIGQTTLLVTRMFIQAGIVLTGVYVLVNRR
jgi:hypothetical protein